MVFSSVTFLFGFLPIFFIFYFLVKKIEYKNMVICVFSAIFYAFGEPRFIILLIISIIINYLFANYLEKNKNKFVLFLAIIYNVLILIIFKYLNLAFLLLNINLAKIPLPIGISFWTFQSMSYVIDVYRNDCKAQKKIQNLFLYIACFPQLIAGPIVRYKDIEEKINNRVVDIDEIYNGIARIVFGISKKIIISNQLANVAEQLLSLNASYLSKGLGIIIFVMQLYFDFSGYSDVAIGIGKIIGFKYRENFNYPILSKTQTEFFRRWHISLSTFFRDYVYIPLGGNKKNQYLNIFIVWFLTGVWHGASVNFILWGLFLGTIIVLEKFIYSILKIEMPIILGNIYLAITTVVSFALFYFDDTNNLLKFFDIKNITLIDIESKIILTNNIFLIIISFILCFPIKNIYENFAKNVIDKNSFFSNAKYIFEVVIMIVLIILSYVFLVAETNNPFLYFRF